MKLNFEEADLGQVHPNTVCIRAKGLSGKTVCVKGASIGGGSILITGIDEIGVELSGQYYTLAVVYKDEPGVIAAVTRVLASVKINIAFIKGYRTIRGGKAIMIIEADQSIPEGIAAQIKQISKVSEAIAIKPVTEE
jgi:L-serine dehydratase